MSAINTLKEMQLFLADKKQLTVLAERAGVSIRTVYDTFDCEDFEKLKGKQLTVAQKAIDLINEIKNMPDAARDALKS